MVVDKILRALDVAWDLSEGDSIVDASIRCGIRSVAISLAEEAGAEEGGFRLLQWVEDHRT